MTKYLVKLDTNYCGTEEYLTVEASCEEHAYELADIKASEYAYEVFDAFDDDKEVSINIEVFNPVEHGDYL